MIDTLLQSRHLNVLQRAIRFLCLSCLTFEVCCATLWPSGRYGLPMPKSGCPATNGFDWQTGYIYQDLEDHRSATTVSPNSQLRGRISAGDVEQYFCIKDDLTATVERNRPQWPAGEYCIYKKGYSCPYGLLSGWVFWDDEDRRNKNAHGGVLPEGEFNRNTKIYFCCQNTFNRYKEPIELPFASPFYLMAFRPRCQDVLYTIHKKEHIIYDTEDDDNTDDKSFPYPYGADFQLPQIYYCYYRECAWTMTALNGTFWSPYYPRNYNNEAWCKWHIKVPWNYSTLITFDDVRLESSCCKCDLVNVWETFPNGTQAFIGSVCDMSTPQIRSSGNNVTVIFRSDASSTGRGFKARYQAIRIRAAKTTTTTTLTSTQTSIDNDKASTMSSGAETTQEMSSTSLTSTQTSTVNDKASTMSSSAETTQGISSTRESRFSSREKTDHITTIETEDLSKTRGEGFSDTLDNESESAASTSLIAGLSASFVVICVIVAVALFCFHKKRSSRKNENQKAPTVSFRPNEKVVDIYATPSSAHDDERNNDCNAYANPHEMYNNSDETVKESDNPLYESDSVSTSARNTIKESKDPLYTGGAESGKTVDPGMYERSSRKSETRKAPTVSYRPDEKAVDIYATPSSAHADERNDDRYAYANPHEMYNNRDETVKESDNPLYKSDSMSTSERNTIEESENPLYTGGAESGKTVDAGIYESVDQHDPNQDEGVYSSPYERVP